MISEDRWNDIMMHLPVHKGDFVYLPAGIVHALKKGSIVYEIQQATDITYRFYDYHRRDQNGNERSLNLEEAIGCVHYELSQEDAHTESTTVNLGNATVTTFIKNDSFCVRRYDICGKQQFSFKEYQLMTCLEGQGTANGIPVSMGESFLCTVDTELELNGNMMLICTSEA